MTFLSGYSLDTTGIENGFQGQKEQQAVILHSTAGQGAGLKMILRVGA